MSPGLSATCMVLPALAEEQLLCHHYKCHPESPRVHGGCSCFRVECRSSNPSVHTHSTAFAWFKRFNSLSPLTTGLNVFRIVRPQCVQLMQSGNFEALSSETGRNLLGERGRGGHSRPLKWGESRARRRGRRHDVYCWHVFVNI